MKKLIILSAIVISGLTFTAAQAQDRHYANNEPARHVQPYRIGVVYRDENRAWNGERNYNNTLTEHERNRGELIYHNDRFDHHEHSNRAFDRR